MYTAQPKKALIVNILEILNKHSDENHRLSQMDIIELLRKEYMMSADRKAVKRNLQSLIECGYDIEYSKYIRTNKNGEEEEMQTDWYIVHKFTDAELRLIIDSLLFSKHIAKGARKDIIKKLESLSSKYFRSNAKFIESLQNGRPENKSLFLTIEILNEAIEKNLQVKFHYNNLETDKKFHPRKDRNGNIREYIINPYHMAALNGHYYLICNYDRYDDISNYRVDRITNIELLDSKRKPLTAILSEQKRLDLSKYLNEHIYMFAGNCEEVVFTAKRHILNELFDWFGGNIEFSNVTDDTLTAKVFVNREAMRFWALQYCLEIRVISPQSLADEVKQNLEQALINYIV